MMRCTLPIAHLSPALRRVVVVALLAMPLQGAGQGASEPASTAPVQNGGTTAEQPPASVPDELLTAMLRMARLSSRDVVVDLGSGEGRVPIIAAREFGARAVGVESRETVAQSGRERAKEAGVQARVKFQIASASEYDFASASVVVLHDIEQIEDQVRPKLLALKPGTRIVSPSSRLEPWEPDERVVAGEHRALLWIVPAKIAGTWRVRLAEGRAPRDFDLVLKQQFQHIEGEARYPGGTIEALKQAFVRGDRVSFLLPGDAGERSGYGQVYGGVIAGTLSDGVRGVRFRADRVGN